MRLPKYSIGMGDRFAHQGPAQLDALIRARRRNCSIAPVWNKSYREHAITGSRPEDVRREADAAVAARDWTDAYFVDADHVNLDTVDAFIESSDFFTLDVADYIGVDPRAKDLTRFVEKYKQYIGRVQVPGINRLLSVSMKTLVGVARTFLSAVKEAGRIYRHIVEIKGTDALVVEISVDEADRPQTPLELLFILAAVADEGIPVQTVAPRFTGRFNKGIDYIGNVRRFRGEFEENLAVIAFAVHFFGLPENLKLSVHSGSDKFSLYQPMYKALQKFDAGVHLKTAGTTWLEELIGLAAAGGDGLAVAREIYRIALSRRDELCTPYASVIGIDPARLPSAETVDSLTGEAFAALVRHDPACEGYNPFVRQLLHVGCKVAAEMGGRFTDALEKHADVIADNVTENLYERHIRPLFLGDRP
ncbi:MAG TPA: tagaturonate epimerase family protein [Thermoguttaceae bacterium]|nr:tagaturonate epimerase family protein [Thermoguttaceae bacterium]